MKFIIKAQNKDYGVQGINTMTDNYSILYNPALTQQNCTVLTQNSPLFQSNLTLSENLTF